ncbi:MAG: hypothetical protein M3Y48_17035 [Actinomycetota bacterium]|nr:hypothetical protein [Actinomycetota bacterium]
MGGSVLVLTRRMDPTADVVVEELNRRAIPVIRFDLGEVVVAAELVGTRWVGQLRAGSRCARLEDTVGVYYRRPSAPTAPPGTDPQIGAWIEAEARWGLRGLLVALPRRLWVNWPPAVHAAEHKPVTVPDQVRVGLLELLDRLGLRFAACDFSWAWDHPLRDAIASAIADALTGETTP